MDRKSIISVTLISVVAIVLIGSMLYPILDDATTEVVEYDNTSGALFRMEEIDAADTYTLKYTITDAQAVVTYDLNGESWTYAKASSAALDVSPVMWDNGFIRQGLTSAGVGTMHAFVIIDGHYEETYISEGTMTVTFDKGTITFSSSTGSGAPSTGSTYTRAYVPAPADGDYVMYSAADTPAVITENTEIYAWGTTTTPYTSHYTAKLQVSGTPDDVSVIAYPAASGSAADVLPDVSDVSVNGQSFGHNGYRFDSVTFTLQIAGQDSRAATFNQIMVPYAVNVHQTSDSSTTGLYMVIPALLIIALIVAFVSIIRRE